MDKLIQIFSDLRKEGEKFLEEIKLDKQALDKEKQRFADKKKRERQNLRTKPKQKERK